MFIEILVILTRMKSSIFLLDEEGRGLWRLGFTNLARFEVLINEFLTCLHFLGIHQISLSYLWNEGFLEIDGMVKGLLRGKFPILWFVEDLGVLGILQGKLLLYSLCCLGKDSRKCELSDVGVVFS